MRRRLGAAHQTLGTVGLVAVVLGLLVLAVGLFGGFFAPHDPNAMLGRPYSPPSAAYWLGLDGVGRDVLSRALYGGRTTITLAVIGVIGIYAIAVPAGMYAGLSRGRGASLLMRIFDAMLAFPALLVLLVLVAAKGAGPAVVIVAAVIGYIPGLARLTRAASLEVSVKSFVDAARLRGERTTSILRREILPNIVPTLAADIGMRFTLVVLLIAGANFLGLGLQPPTADWGLMIAENKAGLILNPWSVLTSTLLIATLAVSINLVADALGRSLASPRVRAELQAAKPE
ncbi:MAG TPA: ABC transporter permease [Anaeromyxobacteraceae bacterium]|nr:ABC transporter permease [Anaeromyxobacteraceae bacterium]